MLAQLGSHARGDSGDETLIDRRLECELEVLERLDAGQVRDLHAHGDALPLFRLDLLPEDLVEEIQTGRLPPGRLIEDRVQSLGDEAQAEALRMLDDAGVHDGTRRGPPTTAS